jgi:hypothetical protein
MFFFSCKNRAPEKIYNVEPQLKTGNLLCFLYPGQPYLYDHINFANIFTNNMEYT